jgi:hypothetical protein
MSEEHLIAAWVLRAFLRQSHPSTALSGTFVSDDQMRLHAEEPISTAKVVCRRCNNEWLSSIDNAAASVLKPLIRGDETVILDGAGQSAFAAWIYKCALIFDASANGNNGDLVLLREQFMATRQAGPGCVIYAGPAGPPPLRVQGLPGISLRLFGVRPINGTLNLAVDVKTHDGGTLSGSPTAIAIPGYQVMLGGVHAYLGGPISPVSPESLEQFQQIWPVAAPHAAVSPTLRG